MLHPYFAAPRPLLFGHRGASGERPENTLPAFERAVGQGVAALETDVHFTRDGEVVVFHDALLERTTDGEGPIAELDLSELRALDAGFRFTADGGRSYPFRGCGTAVAVANVDAPPTLLFNETPRRGAWLSVDAPGALRVVVETQGRRWVRDRVAGASYLSVSGTRFHFGLGAAARVDRLSVTWPGGKRTVVRDVGTDRVVVVSR